MLAYHFQRTNYGGNMKHCEEADGLMGPDKDTDGFVFNHLMLRIKDPKKTLNFY